MQTLSCNWLEALSVDGSLELLEDLSVVLADRGGRVGWYLYTCLRDRNWDALLGYNFDYVADWDVSQLMACRQIQALFAKAPFLPVKTDTEREAAAFSKFLESEASCLETNLFFRKLSSGDVLLHPDAARILYGAQRKIRRVLGTNVPRMEEFKFRFGPGATTRIKKTEATVQQKLADSLTCSERLARSPWLPEILRSLPHISLALSSKTGVYISDDSDEESYYETLEMTIEEGRLAFVPKNAMIHRGIDVQPTLNTLIQSGVGDWLANRIKVVGIDVRDQTPNQRCARVGSLTGLLSTIDLSSASDTVSTELVRFLLPEEWYSFLRSLTADVVYKDQDFRLSRFCSMGNGFTFPLESLIFWAISATACEGQADLVHVYGDDIIVPTNRFGEVVYGLRAAGFQVNWKKSYSSTPFRESCGSDYYAGFDIRPYYLDQDMTGETLFSMHNFFYRALDTELCEVILRRIPEPLRLFGPDGYGDGHLLGDWDPYTKRAFRRFGYGGVLFDTYCRLGRKTMSVYPGDWVSPLYSIYVRGESLTEVLAEETRFVLSLRTSTGLVSPWAQSKVDASTPIEFSKNGRPYWSLPGSEGYAKRSIYTHSR